MKIEVLFRHVQQYKNMFSFYARYSGNGDKKKYKQKLWEMLRWKIKKSKF